MILPDLIEHAIAQELTIIPTTDIGCDFIGGDIHWDCIPNYIQYLANMVVGFTVAICLIMLMINGYKYAMGPVLGQGTNEGAKRGILFALLGTGIALLAYLIIDTVFVALTV